MRRAVYSLVMLLMLFGLLGAAEMKRSRTTVDLLNSPGLEVRPAEWAQALDLSYHLYQVDEQLYRSALPRAHDLLWLQQQNVRTVINFYQKPDSRWLNDPKIEQVHLPLRTDRIDDEDVLQALRSIARAQTKGKVLIHCKHGQNRTGLIAAMYRIIFQGWNKADALREMQQGYGGEKRMAGATRYLEEVDIVAIQRALAEGSCSTAVLAWCKVGQWFERYRKH